MNLPDHHAIECVGIEVLSPRGLLKTPASIEKPFHVPELLE
jgi:hypothetical protein